MKNAVKGLWNIVLSGYPKAGKTTLAKRLTAENQYFARVGVDELREMFFNETYPSRDEFLIYSLIAEMRDALLKRGYNAIIDSTAPDNVTREFLLTTKVKPINRLLVVLTVDKEILLKRSIEKFGNASLVFAWEKRWEKPKGGMPIFKFRSNDMQEFNAYYARLEELLESEMHPFKPEFHPSLLPLKEIRRALKNFLEKR
jgi:predicted kinase